MRVLHRLAILALAGAGTAALAQQPQPMDQSQPMGQPQPMERPHGHPRTLAEFQARMRDKMMRLDTNRDGRVSLQEYQAGMAARANGHDPARAFSRMDLNHDGFIDQHEMDAASAQRFARRDTNHDGVLTPDDRPARRGAMAPQR